jgi:hypothetical protein
MSTTHPNFWDRLAVKIYPSYLYPSQYCLADTTLSVGIIHLVPGIKPEWKIMDYVYLSKDSSFRYLGLGRNLKLSGDVQPIFTILEVVYPYIDQRKSPGKQMSPGDIVCITPFDRPYIRSAPPDYQNQPHIMEILDAQAQSLQI